jgi:hypothetical protein
MQTRIPMGFQKPKAISLGFHLVIQKLKDLNWAIPTDFRWQIQMPKGLSLAIHWGFCSDFHWQIQMPKGLSWVIPTGFLTVIKRVIQMQIQKAFQT